MEIKLNNNKIISIEGKDVLHLVLKTNNLLIEEIKNNDIIESLLIDNEYKISLNDKIEVEYTSKLGDIYKTFYIINKFEKSKNCYKLIEFIENEENIFLIPTILAYGNEDNYSINRYFINSFLQCNLNSWKDKKDLLFLQYRFFPFESYEILDKFLKSRSNYISIIPNGRFNIYLFKIPDKFINDVNYYKEGSYNKISDSYKNKIVNYYNFKKGNEIYDLFYNEQSLRDKLSIELGVEIPSNICPRSKPKLNIYE